MLQAVSLLLFVSASTLGSEEVTNLTSVSISVHPISTTAAPVQQSTAPDPEWPSYLPPPCRFISPPRLSCYKIDLRNYGTKGDSIQTITHIELRNPKSQNFIKEDLEKFPRLQSLIIEDSKISHIQPDSFSKSSNLTSLRFEGILHDIAPELFNSTKITSLELSNYPTKLNIPQNRPFLVSDSVKQLKLRDCNISEFYAESFQLPKLSKLLIFESQKVQLTISPKMLEKTNISTLILRGMELVAPQGKPFLNSKTLKSLELKNVKLKELFSEIFMDLPCLENLTITRDNQKSIKMSSDILIQTNVTKLEFINLKLETSKSQSILKSQVLKHIYLKNSGIKFLTRQTFQDLPNLENVDLWEDETSQIDLRADAFKRTKVSKLKLKNMPVNDGNKTFIVSENLKELILVDQDIKTLTQTFMDGMPNLEKLIITIDKTYSFITPISLSPEFLNNTKLKNLKFEYVPINIEENKPLFASEALTELHVTNAKLQTLYHDTFSLLLKLEKLYLNYNKLERLPAGIFENNEKLKQLDLSYNQFTTLDMNIFGGDIQYRRVITYFYGNPWVCDCALLPMIHYHIKTVGMFSKAKCKPNISGPLYYNWFQASAILRSICSRNQTRQDS